MVSCMAIASVASDTIPSRTIWLPLLPDSLSLMRHLERETLLLWLCAENLHEQLIMLQGKKNWTRLSRTRKLQLVF